MTELGIIGERLTRLYEKLEEIEASSALARASAILLDYNFLKK